MRRSFIARLSTVGYKTLRQIGIRPSANLFHHAKKIILVRGPWAEIKSALLDEIEAQKNSGASLFAKQELNAINRLPNKPALFTEYIFANGEFPPDIRSVTQPEAFELTAGQKDALNKCLSKPLMFLMGAPGTGKTRVISRAISHLLSEGESVLLCCHTRAALDHSAMHLDNVHENLSLRTIVALLQSPAPIRIDNVIVDEAGMASLPQVLAISNLAIKRLIFVGDPMQLPPVAATKNPWVNQNIYQHVSKTENLSALYVWQRKNDANTALLKEQFDIPERLFNVLNHFCYGGRLFSRSTGKGHINFIDSTGLGAANSGKRSSPTNEVHAGLVIEALNQVLEKKSVSPERVGVLTPFTAQASFLQKKVKEAGLPQGIEFGTVHTFQGRLKNCLILDTTAAGVDYTYKNLADDNQAQALMNSALSRCRTIDGTEGRLIVIADIEHMRQHYVGSAALQFLDRLFFRADILDVENVKKYGQATAVLVELFLADWKAIDKALASGTNPKQEEIKTLIYNACDLIPRQIALINRLKPGAFSADSALQALEKPYALLGLAELSPETEFDPERINRFKSVITDLYKIIYESTMIPVPGEHRNRGPDKPIYDPNAEDGESYGRSRLWIRELRNHYQHDSEKPEDYRKEFSKRQRDFAFKAGIARTAPDESTNSLDVPEDYSTTEYFRVALLLLTEVIAYLKEVRIRI